tara:strand:- start:485 stop:1447 length:963 start_codon:yes stop_codon:yes gene_type:complete
MKRYILLLSLIGISKGETNDELENLYNKKQYIFKNATLDKNTRLWYTKDTDQPYTGILEVYLKRINNYKVAECNMVDGLKNGIFIQYYNKKEKIIGIRGLYVNNKKEGSWIWVKSDNNYIKTDKNLDFKTVKTIDYRGGIKHGSTIVHKSSIQRPSFAKNYSYPRHNLVFQGQYFDGEKTGEWYYYDYKKDSLSTPFYWSRKFNYLNDNLVNSQCRDPFGKKIDCDTYEQNNQYKIYESDLIEKSKAKVKNTIINSILTIKDDIGNDVGINIEEFINHINSYHYSPISVHQQGGHYFTVDKNFRKLLNKKLSMKKNHNTK